MWQLLKTVSYKYFGQKKRSHYHHFVNMFLPYRDPVITEMVYKLDIYM